MKIIVRGTYAMLEVNIEIWIKVATSQKLPEKGFLGVLFDKGVYFRGL